MASKLNILTARFVTTAAEVGRHADGGGLFLHIRQRGDKAERVWVFKYKRGERGATREHWIGLGPVRDVSLAQARELARKCREALASGQDPRLAVNRTKDAVPTFGFLAEQLVDDIAPGFKSEITVRNWRRTLSDAYCASIRKKPGDDRRCARHPATHLAVEA